MKKNNIACIIQVIAGAIIALGVILGIVVAVSNNPFVPYSSIGFAGFIVVIVPCIISSVLLFGFAEIIFLLQQIRDGEKKNEENSKLPML